MTNRLEIEDLPFRDIYLSGDPSVPPMYNPKRIADLKRPTDIIPEAYLQAAKDLYDRALAVENRIDFALQLSGMRVRVIRTRNHLGFTELCFRALPTKIPNLKDLNYTPDFLEEATSWLTRKGIVLTVGETGSGKTTLIMALLDYALDNVGGVILTLEDPVEFVLRTAGIGDCGQGFKTIQWEILSDEDLPAKIKDCLRYAPNIILCGEIRSPETTAAALNLANSGHLVIASIHGSTCTAGLQRLSSFAAASALGESSGDVLAEAFTGVAHQRISNGMPVVNYLSMERNPDILDPTRNYLRKGDLKMLSGIIERQANSRASKPIRRP